MITSKVYQRISSLLQAIENCHEASNNEWLDKHSERLEEIMRTAPSGSGIDSGTVLCGYTDAGGSQNHATPKRLLFHAGYHHMHESGMYDGWTEHDLIVTPSLQFGYILRITGKNRKGIKEYLYEVYSMWLDSETEI